MFLASASTKRPIAMTCLLIALIILGVNSFRKMSVEDMPSVDIPYITIMTTWVGASPEDVEKDVTKHIEDAVSGIDGLKHVESINLENFCNVVLEFNMGVDVDVAAQDVREKLDAVLTELPSDADRPVIQKINVNATSVAQVFLTGDSPIDDIYDYADNKMSDRFSSIRGVAQVDVIGGNEREVWVELDREKLSAAGLTTADVVSALQSGIINMPGGRIRERGMEYSVRFDAEYSNIPDIGTIEVVSKEGMRLRISDLGTVRQATEEVRERVIVDGRQGVLLKITKKAEGNTVAVVDAVRERFEEIKAELPGGMEAVWVSDEAENVQASVNSAIESLWQAILVCAVILFVFLVNVRTTIVVAITMPVTILISIFFMQMAGQSLNTVTLLALGLSTGVLVSNSIVVLENVVSKMDECDNKWQAACDGTSEVAISVLASAGTNVVVMFPLALMSSLVGKMLTPFAITSLIINAVSIFISFTLTPILCAMLLKSKREQKDSAMTRFAQRYNNGFTRLSSRYAAFIRRFVDNRVLNVVIAVAFAVFFFWSMKTTGGKVGFTFFQPEDLARVFIRVEFPPYYDLEKTQGRLDKIQDRLLDFSDIVHVVTTAGKAESTSGQATEGVYMGQIELYFKSKLERDWTMNDRLIEIRKVLSEEPDCLASATVPSKQGGQNFMIDYTILGDDLTQLETSVNGIKNEALSTIPEISVLDTTIRDTKPELRVLPKRTIMADMGLPATTLGAIVRGNVDGVEAANYKRGDRTYDIRVKLKEIEGRDQIKGFMLPGIDGNPIPLETVADVTETRMPLMIYRRDKQRAAKFLGDIVPGATMSDVSAKLEKIANEGDHLPPGYEMTTAGLNEMMGEMIADFGEAIILATVLTILTLCAILESWKRPALVLLTLPMGLIGVMWSLVLTHQAMTIFTLLGMLMLIGIVVNAAILIVDRMGQLMQDNGMPPRVAMIAALRDQFRPVLMVILASGLGMLPIALTTGIGSENRAVMGIASLGGILVAGLLTLTVLPLVYTLFTKKNSRK